MQQNAETVALAGVAAEYWFRTGDSMLSAVMPSIARMRSPVRNRPSSEVSTSSVSPMFMHENGRCRDSRTDLRAGSGEEQRIEMR